MSRRNEGSAAVEDPAAELWMSLPGSPVREPLQQVYERTASALVDLARKWQEKRQVDPVARRREAIAALEPLFGLLGETWRRAAKERPELDALERQLAVRAETTRMPSVRGSVALGWLLVEHVVATLGVPAPTKQATWTLGALRWSTSVEDVYRAAFEVLGDSWVSVPKKAPAAGPWSIQARAAAALGAAIEAGNRVPAPLDDTQPTPTGQGATGVAGVVVQAEGKAGHVGFLRARAADVGAAHGSGNAQLDGSELIDLALSFERPGAAGTMISESLVPASVPDCVVVKAAEVEFPEVARYGVATVANRLLVSGRCRNEPQRVRFTVRSSQGEPTSVQVLLNPKPEPAVTVDLRRDADVAGASVEHDAGQGLVAGRSVELLAAFAGPAGTDARLRSMGLALPADDAIATLEPPRFGTSHAIPTGFVLDDDADLRMVSGTPLAKAFEARDRASLFGSDPGALWLAVELSFQRNDVNAPARVEPAPTPSRSADGKGRKPAPAAVVITPRMEQAEAWLGERLPTGTEPLTLLVPIASAAKKAAETARARFGDVKFVDPTVGQATEALTDLLKRNVLAEAELRMLLDHFEVTPAVASAVAGALMVNQSRAGATVTALLAHVDAHAAKRARATPRATGVGDDTARGVGVRVATAAAPSKELEQTVAQVFGGEEGVLAAADRKLARALMLASAVTKSLTQDQARAVLSLLGIANLDVLGAPAAVHRAVTLGLLVDALKLQRAPDLAMADALVEFVSTQARAAGESGGSAERALAPGAILVRRWVRVPLVGGSQDPSTPADSSEPKPTAGAAPPPPPAVEPTPAPEPPPAAEPTPAAEPAAASSTRTETAAAPSPEASSPTAGKEASEPPATVRAPAGPNCGLAFGPRVGLLGPNAFGSLGFVLSPPGQCLVEAGVGVGFKSLVIDELISSTALPILALARFWFGATHSLLLDGGLGATVYLQEAIFANGEYSRSGVVLASHAGVGYGFRQSPGGGWRFGAVAGVTMALGSLPESGNPVESVASDLLGSPSFLNEPGFALAPYGEFSASYLFGSDSTPASR